MLTTVTGIVLREKAWGESDKFIDILTEEAGLVSVCVKGGRKLGSKNAGATQLYTYSKFCYSSRGTINTLNSSEVITSFFKISEDLVKLSLASYFSELLQFCVPESVPSNNVMRLVLNTFYFLDSSKRDADFLKSVFEFRLLCEIGLMPDLIGCSECYKFTSNSMYFDILGGKLYCSECFKGELDFNTVRLGDSELHTLRHIALSDFDKLFNFKLSPELQKNVSSITEKYVLAHFDRNFKTLSFLKSIQGGDQI